MRGARTVTGNTERTRPENRAFYPALDGLRAVAFLMVFAQHYVQLPWGFMGVNVFFVLSGFLITGILFDTRDDPHRARNFYIRRTLRIFPLYYGVFLVVLLLEPFMHWEWSAAWIAWPLYAGNFLLYLSPAAAIHATPQQIAAFATLNSPRTPLQIIFLGHFWSLCVEEQFYLLWPWIVFWASGRRALLWICSVVVLLGPLLRILAYHTAPHWMLQLDLLYRFTPFQLDSLLLGGLINLLWRGPHREQLLLAARIVATIAAVLVIFYLSRTIHLSDHYWRRDYVFPSWRLTVGLPFVNVFSAAIILCILRPAGLLYRFFNLLPLRWIGRISYGAYVLHDILHEWYEYIFLRMSRSLVRHVSSHLMFLETHHTVLIPPFALFCTLLLAWLSFRFYESPFLNLKERWTIRGSSAKQAPELQLD